MLIPQKPLIISGFTFSADKSRAETTASDCIKYGIFIDPPYNRGKNDFVYDDAFVGAEDTFKHSKWISFMDKRLHIAYNLLSDNGLLFVSIDDNEQAVLKNLLDEVFSEGHFIIALPRITKKSGKTTGSFSKNHDYVLVYTKQNQDIFVMEEHNL